MPALKHRLKNRRENSCVKKMSKKMSKNFVNLKKDLNFALANGGIAQLVRASDS